MLEAPAHRPTDDEASADVAAATPQRAVHRPVTVLQARDTRKPRSKSFRARRGVLRRRIVSCLMDTAAAGAAPSEGASPAERVLQVGAVAEQIALHLARCGDVRDLGRASCASKALRAACSAERAWEHACQARFCTAAAARASLEAAAAAGFSWRGHALERLQRPWTPGDGRVCTAALADMALLLVDVWHGGRLVLSATLSPKADEMLEDETYSDSDDVVDSGEWKAEFAVNNEIREGFRYRGGVPTFVNAGRLRASAWLLRRRDARMVRIMCRVPAELETVAEGSVAWAGSRRFVFSDGELPNGNVSLHLAGWLVQENTGRRWWPETGDPEPQPRDLRQLRRLCVRWKA